MLVMASYKALVLMALCWLLPCTAMLVNRQSDEYIHAGLLAVRSASPIHFEGLNASDSLFWIFKETSVYCPVPAPDCAGYPNQTFVTIYNDTSLQYQAFMDATVPGGQNVYVAESGALSFTEPHEEYNFPDGSYTNGFSYSTNENNITFLSFTGGGADSWFACPTSSESPTSYQVFANVAGFNDSVIPQGCVNDCLGFGLIAEPLGADAVGAFQYE